MNAIELLKQDHERVRELFEELEGTTERARKQRAELLDRVALELEIHSAIEEEIFYPAFRGAGGPDEQKLYNEAVEEHRAIKEFVIPDLQETDVASPQFAARAKLLKDLVLHHVEEEESEMFIRAEELLTESQLEQLGSELQIRKAELQQAAGGR